MICNYYLHPFEMDCLLQMLSYFGRYAEEFYADRMAPVML